MVIIKSPEILLLTATWLTFLRIPQTSITLPISTNLRLIACSCNSPWATFVSLCTRHSWGYWDLKIWRCKDAEMEKCKESFFLRRSTFTRTFWRSKSPWQSGGGCGFSGSSGRPKSTPGNQSHKIRVIKSQSQSQNHGHKVIAIFVLPASWTPQFQKSQGPLVVTGKTARNCIGKSNICWL